MKKHSRILVISDSHAPATHRDAYKWLAKLNEILKPDLIVHLGDEIDHRAISFHDKDGEALGASEELERAKWHLKQLADIFPSMLLCHSNHSSLVTRRAKKHGLPLSMIKELHEIYNTPTTWQWADHWDIKSGDKIIRFMHYYGANYLNVSKSLGLSFAQGHAHSKMGIQHWRSATTAHFGMQVGGLLDDTSDAFSYNKLQKDRPQLSVGYIEDGTPFLFPFFLDKNNRWTGRVI
jgi:hypothetical protein